jgi:hypothetical protein
MFMERRYFAVTMKFMITIIDSEEMVLIHDQVAIIDVLNSKDTNFSPPAQQLVATFQQSLREKNYEVEKSNARQPQLRSVVIFLKDLAVHGASNRLVTFGCEACALYAEGRISTLLKFLLGEESGPMLEVLQSCSCDIVFAPNLFLSESSDIHSPSDDILSEVIDWSLIDLLNRTDMLVIPNTLGDVQSNALLRHIDIIRQLKIFSETNLKEGEKDADFNIRDVFVALDLCNIFHPYIFGDGFESWDRVVDGLIAPSVYVQQSNWTVSSRKPVEVAYPLLMTHWGDGSPAFPSVIRPWPRLAAGRFRVGLFGRCSFERSPGLFIRTVALVLQLRSEAYVRKHFDFVVVGGGNFLATLQELAGQLGVAGLITFTGQDVSNKDMIAWLCSSDLVVNPKYRGETFGILQAEAMACGTPVLTFNRSASQESLHPLASHLVQHQDGAPAAGDSDDHDHGYDLLLRLAEAIIDALEQPQARFNWTTESLATAARETKELLDPRRGTYQFLSALRELKRVTTMP